jgi:hypothetical protein
MYPPNHFVLKNVLIKFGGMGPFEMARRKRVRIFFRASRSEIPMIACRMNKIIALIPPALSNRMQSNTNQTKLNLVRLFEQPAVTSC